MSLRPLAAALALTALVACDHPHTQIVVLIETDMTQGPAATLTHVRVTVKGAADGVVRQRLTYPLRDTRGGAPYFELPGTLGVVAQDDDGTRSVEVNVDAVNDPNGDGTTRPAMFTYYAVAPFASQETLLLTVFLADRCRAAASLCTALETCGPDRCVPRRVADLPVVSPDFRPDASSPDVVATANVADPPDARDDARPMDAPDVADAPDAAPPTDGPCPSGLTRCGAACVDTLTSAAHCGACGAACTAGTGATATCVGGRCNGACAAGLGDCDGNAANGCEADLAHDPRNCGRCAAVCASMSAASTCAAGACHATCNPGFGDCDGVAANGCETSLATSANCGACGSACALPDTATQACTGGACAIGACPAGRADCDMIAANGCEVDAQNDGANCGACGRRCPTGQFCSGGACSARCATGLVACGSLCADVRTNPMNCGACGAACPTRAGGFATCAAGHCGVVCNAGFGDCDGNAANGCEASLGGVANCGACHRSCVVANAGATCAMGSCGFTCNAGFGDCDGNAATGCETDLRTTMTSCGTCGAACVLPHATGRCDAGRCGVASCATGWGDCDANPTNGCETDLRSTATSCGACGRACTLANATATCAAGACAIDACRAGYADCDGMAANGCELHTAADCGSPDRCVTGVTSCVSGAPSCATTPLPCGRPCGMAGRCDGMGACVAREMAVCDVDAGPEAGVDAPLPDVALDLPVDLPLDLPLLDDAGPEAPPPDAGDDAE